MPCRHDQMLSVVCRILASLSHCWFVCFRRPTSTITFGMVFSTTWLEFKDMAPDPLVRREPISASCHRRPDEGLETQHTVYAPRNIQPTGPMGFKSGIMAGQGTEVTDSLWKYVVMLLLLKVEARRCHPYTQAL
jgi:hypothetical protein